MKEQSHKEEMASVLKADFDRLRARGVATTLAPMAPTEAPEPEVAVQDPESVENAVETARPVTEVAPPTSSGGWLRRLLGPS